MRGGRGLIVTLGLLTGCGRIGFGETVDGGVDVADAPAAGDAPPDGDPDGALSPEVACSTPAEVMHDDEGTAHQDGGVIDYNSNPPTSGTHYPEWARWNHVYSEVIPRGYWVHNLEHGGIVYTYNCPEGCPGEVARFQAMIDALPLETECIPLVHRAIVTPDPDLPAGVRFAASAWRYSISSSCLDEAAMHAFYVDHYNEGPEFQCTDGTYPAMP